MMMTSPYSSKAIQLAKAKYLTIVFLDAAGTEDEGYIALHPQLEGCMSQGDSAEDAINNLEDARLLYIESLLQDGLDVPEPLLSNNNHIIINMAELMGQSHEADNSLDFAIAYDVQN